MCGWLRLPLFAAVLCASLWAASTDLESARQAYAERRFQAAAELLLRHLDQQPEDYDALLLLGLSLEQSDDALQAEKVFREAVRRRPGEGRAHLFVARALFLQGRFEPALNTLETAVERGADSDRAAHLRGLILAEQGDHEAALVAFRKARDAQAQAAAALLKMQRPQDALDELADAKPSDEVRYQRALAYAALDERDAAIRELDKVAEHPEAKALRRRLRAMPDSPARTEPARKQPSPVRFVERGKQAGLDFVLNHNPTPEKHLPETMAGGLAVFDANGDGLLDIFFTNGATTPELEKEPRHANRLYLNRGELRFEDVTNEAGLSGKGFSIGAAVADYDNDGDLDLFVAGVRRNLLYRNRGNGGFDEVSTEAGISSEYWSVGGAWLDYDNDGLLDLFVANYLRWDAETAPACSDKRTGVRTYCHPKFFEPAPNQLYRNLGDGRFEDVSERAGLTEHRGKAMSAALADVDDDGDLDIFVPNDAIPNSLFLNQGDGRFEEAALTAGVALKDDGVAVSSMGSAFGDLDGDGREDLLFTALPGETFPLFRNEGAGYFLDRTYSSRLGSLSQGLGGWGVALEDFNNDGAVDVMTANSHVMDNAEAFSSETYRQPNAIWLNRGNGSFVEPTSATGFAERKAAHRGLIAADFDRDGRMDAVVSALGERPELWRNNTPVTGCWLAVHLRGNTSNRDGVGTVVRIGGQTRRYTTAGGYGSSYAGPLHFILEDCDQPIELEIEWSRGSSISMQVDDLNTDIEVQESSRNQQP